MFILDIIAHAVPFMVMVWDSGFYSTFNSTEATEYIETWLNSKEAQG